ncbi:MAG: carboxypeptidase M32, partial [Pseudomonadota bacterium]
MSLELLLDHLKQTAALSQVSGLIAWDQETMMPERGAQQRADQAGAMAAVIHARDSDPRISE